jgi:hypothetical protein
VTDATPELFVTAITFEPLLVPFESDPPLVVKRMLAPELPPPELPGVNVTVKGTGSVLPGDPVCTSPSVLASVAAGLPTTIQPPCVCVTAPSVAVTVKWQKPGILPAFTVISPCCVGLIAEVVRLIVSPVHTVDPSKASTTADDIVTFVEPLVIFGANVTVPPAATIVVSGFRSHSEVGVLAMLPLTTTNVAV